MGKKREGISGSLKPNWDKVPNVVWDFWELSWKLGKIGQKVLDPDKTGGDGRVGKVGKSSRGSKGERAGLGLREGGAHPGKLRFLGKRGHLSGFKSCRNSGFTSQSRGFPSKCCISPPTLHLEAQSSGKAEFSLWECAVIHMQTLIRVYKCALQTGNSGMHFLGTTSLDTSGKRKNGINSGVLERLSVVLGM